ncbi:hypothetical protein HPB52_020351 [Rhipicephalus sanguineus]|uniref:Uncharacterized protein n=1 Tax=Rhipicephalus sanguineus TaxID=34632 RepID=A0A9D4PKH3_RHISA|nr:hypothetical protein HPB52_020351 [Rhipicephalus sanguineus]
MPHAGTASLLRGQQLALESRCSAQPLIIARLTVETPHLSSAELTVETPPRDPRCSRQGVEQQARPCSRCSTRAGNTRKLFGGYSTESSFLGWILGRRLPMLRPAILHLPLLRLASSQQAFSHESHESSKRGPIVVDHL